MFIAQLNMTFFFAPVSEAQNSLESFDSITRHPKMTLIKPVSWDSAEAKATMLAKSVG